MSADPIWETVHRSHDWGAGPLPDFPGLIVRRCGTALSVRLSSARHRILEIGCGGGANVLHMAAAGLDVVGIDSSPAAISLCRKRLKEQGLSAEVVTMDAIDIGDYFPPGSFDGVVDVRCLQHLRLSDQRAIVAQIRELLTPGGWVYSRTAAVGSWGDGTGTRVEERTYTDISQGPARDRGLVRFATSDDVLALWTWVNWEGHLMADNWLTRDGDELGWWREWIIEGRKQT